MFKTGIIVIAIVVLIIAGALLVPGWLEQPPIVELAHRPYLEEFLAGTGLTFVPTEKNGFAYYELHTAEEELAGFVFPGKDYGYMGYIDLFVKTDAAGIIQRVHVWHHTETPIYVVGLDDFLATFADHKAEAELIWQENVHGITRATETAKSIILAVYEPGRAAYQKGIFVRE